MIKDQTEEKAMCSPDSCTLAFISAAQDGQVEKLSNEVESQEQD